MRSEPGDRRRFTIAYALSIVIHALALFALIVFVVRQLDRDAFAEPTPTANISLETPQPIVATQAPSPQPTLTARPPTPQPTRTAAPIPPTHAPVRRAPTPHPTAPPRKRELAVIRPSAFPLPPPRPSVPPTPTETAEPTPTPAPLVALTVPSPQPTPAPTRPPTPTPTVAPTIAPTVAPTPSPTAVPTTAPTVAPTRPPTPAPTVAPTRAPTAAPTTAPTSVPTAVATSAATAAPRPSASAGPAKETDTARLAGPTAGRPVPIGTAAPTHVAAAVPATASPRATNAAGTGPVGPPPVAPTPAGNDALGNLNARLKATLPQSDQSTIKRFDPGAYTTQRVLDAYEAKLAPPLEILAKTFGLIRVKRTLSRADSVAYVYERVKTIFGERCRAYRITEHPQREATVYRTDGGPNFPGPLRDLPPVIETIEVDCHDKAIEPVTPGSITTPVPRHP